MASSPWTHALRQRAWTFGRELRDQWLAWYREEYGVEHPPAPAMIGRELIHNCLGARLEWRALGHDRFGETAWVDGAPVVTINTLIPEFRGVKDAEGVENVTILHEGIHVVKDRDRLDRGPQMALWGLDPRHRVVCAREFQRTALPSDPDSLREFFAEEAARAAAVSHVHLGRTAAFRALMRFGARGGWSNAQRWGMVNEAAGAIGVNRTALVTQLRLEGVIVIEQEEGRSVLRVQPELAQRMEVM